MADAKVKISVSVKEAKAKMRDLKRKTVQRAKRTRGIIARFLPAAAGAGIGLKTVQRILPGASSGTGMVDPFTTALAPIEATVQSFMTKMLGANLEAKVMAMVDVRELFGTAVQEDRDVSAARRFYEVATTLREEETEGRRHLIERYPGPDLIEVLEAGIMGWLSSFDVAVEAMWSFIEEGRQEVLWK